MDLPTVQNCSGTWNCSGGLGLTADNGTPCQKGNGVEEVPCSWNWRLDISWASCNPAIHSITVASCGSGGPVTVIRPANDPSSTITGTCHAECDSTARPLILFKDITGAEVGRCELHMPCDSCD